MVMSAQIPLKKNCKCWLMLQTYKKKRHIPVKFKSSVVKFTSHTEHI